AAKAGCCGAVKFHLNDQDAAKAQMRANIDAWWPYVAPGEGLGVEAIVMNASGCGVTVKDYGHLLHDDPAYADKARRISELTRDLSELLPEIVAALRSTRPEVVEALRQKAPTLAYHPPCTLQHGQKLRGGVEQHLGELGFQINTARVEPHLCCGSAGTYSVLNPSIAYELRDRKLGNLAELHPQTIV
ncbi:heterodisulfide reductase-related iron-sulfur binding cluster, partial [Leptospira sp. 96542]|nr:heterodisulfide reductase-related iron-sulfur binding cluster [Leptospira sp. 96542]